MFWKYVEVCFDLPAPQNRRRPPPGYSHFPAPLAILSRISQPHEIGKGVSFSSPSATALPSPQRDDDNHTCTVATEEEALPM